MYLYDTHITRDDPQSPPLYCTLAVVQQDPAISPPLDNSAVSFLAEIQQCEPQADDADADDVGVAAIVGNASITGGDPQVANGSYSQSVVAAGELHGDIENGVVVNVGHTRAQWLIEYARFPDTVRHCFKLIGLFQTQTLPVQLHISDEETYYSSRSQPCICCRNLQTYHFQPVRPASISPSPLTSHWARLPLDDFATWCQPSARHYLQRCKGV